MTLVDTSIWVDCGNGTFGHLQQHLEMEKLTAVVLTHGHPDHCVDIYGLHVMYKYGLEMSGLPVFLPEGLEKTLEGLVGDWTDTFDWNLVRDGDCGAHQAVDRTARGLCCLMPCRP